MNWFVLVALTWIGGYASGATISFQEFSNKDACEAASAVINQQSRAWRIDDKIRTFCVPK
jgi:hypothetical protein